MARKKGGGGKLNRSEIIQARLDPNMHMAAEIMARADRRTLSSYIEKAIELAARDNIVKRNLKFLWWLEGNDKYYVGLPTFDEVTVEKAVQDISHDQECVRFVRFATYFPNFLTLIEKEIFKDILHTPYFWFHYSYPVEDQYGNFVKTEWRQVEALDGLDEENLVEYWYRIKFRKIDILELAMLDRDKELSGPMKTDVRPIRKKIVYDEEHIKYKIIYSYQQDHLEISLTDPFWKKNSIFMIAQHINVIDEFRSLVTIRPNLSKKGEKILDEFNKRKRDLNVNQIHKNNTKQSA